jgi:hypothetical protein
MLHAHKQKRKPTKKDRKMQASIAKETAASRMWQQQRQGPPPRRATAAAPAEDDDDNDVDFHVHVLIT